MQNASHASELAQSDLEDERGEGGSERERERDVGVREFRTSGLGAKIQYEIMTSPLCPFPEDWVRARFCFSTSSLF